MSTSALNQALDIALGLSPADRASLVYDLLASLDDPEDANALDAWEVEIARRLDAFESGKAQTVDADEVLRRIDAQLKR
jgi:putative addiction module component (TIGR02574 family)